MLNLEDLQYPLLVVHDLTSQSSCAQNDHHNLSSRIKHTINQTFVAQACCCVVMCRSAYFLEQGMMQMQALMAAMTENPELAALVRDPEAYRSSVGRIPQVREVSCTESRSCCAACGFVMD